MSRNTLASLVFSFVTIAGMAASNTKEGFAGDATPPSLADVEPSRLIGKSREETELYLKGRGFISTYLTREMLLVYPGIVRPPAEDLSGRIYTSIRDAEQRGLISTSYGIEIDIDLSGRVKDVRTSVQHTGP